MSNDPYEEDSKQGRETVLNVTFAQENGKTVMFEDSGVFKQKEIYGEAGNFEGVEWS